MNTLIEGTINTTSSADHAWLETELYLSYSMQKKEKDAPRLFRLRGEVEAVAAAPAGRREALLPDSGRAAPRRAGRLGELCILCEWINA